MNYMISSYILCFALDMSLQRSIVLPAVLLRGIRQGNDPEMAEKVLLEVFCAAVQAFLSAGWSEGR